MMSEPPSEMLEIPTASIEDAIKRVRTEIANESRTEQAKDILFAVQRTLHWIKAGAKGPLFDPTATLCSEQITQTPNALGDPGFHCRSTTDRAMNAAEVVVSKMQSVSGL